MGQDDVKISDLWEDFFFGVCGFILNPSPIGEASLDWLSGLWSRRFGGPGGLSQLLGNFCSNLGTIIPQTWGQ